MPDDIKYLVWDGVYRPTDAGALNQTYPPKPKESEQPQEQHSSVSHGSGVTLSTLRVDIRIVAVDPVFAPLKENCVIEVKFKNLEKVGSLLLQIHDLEENLVYAEELDRAQILALPGEGERKKAVDANKGVKTTLDPNEVCASPGGGPYYIKIWIRPIEAAAKFGPTKVADLGKTSPYGEFNFEGVYDNGASPSQADLAFMLEGLARKNVKFSPLRTSVNVHSIELELAPWEDIYKKVTKAANGDYPGTGNAPKEASWVAFKLNALGFYAGPIAGDPNNAELKKAIVRYRQAHKDLYVHTADKAGFVFGHKAVTLNSAIDKPLTDALTADTNPRAAFDDPAAITDDQKKAKLYLDSDRFMRDVDQEFVAAKREAKQTVKAKLEEEWLSRPRLALRAKIFIEKSDGTKVHVPEASHDVPIKWTWRCQDPDLTDLPKRTKTQPSNAADYLKDAFDAVKQHLPADYPNAPVLVGGLISGKKADDKASVWEQLDDCVLTKAAATAAWDVETAGPLVYFCSSVIGGDRYQLEAVAQGWAGDEPSKYLPVDRVAKTGWLEVWRRLQIASQVCWSKDAVTDPWTKVKAEYAQARVEVVPPTPKKMAAVKDQGLTTKFGQLLGQCGINGLALSDDTVDPRDLSTLKVTETDANAAHAAVLALLDANGAYTAWKDSNDVTASAKTERAAALKLVQGWQRGSYGTLSTLKTDSLLAQAGQFYAKEIAKILKEANPKETDAPQDIQDAGGLKLFQWKKANKSTKFVANPTASHRKLDTFVADTKKLDKALQETINDKLWNGLLSQIQVDVLLELRRIVGPGVLILEYDPHAPVMIDNKPYVSFGPPNMSTGGECVIINRAYYKLGYDSEHLFAHEVAHALFMVHHKNGNGFVEVDHDTGDENCIMSYIRGDSTTGVIVGQGDHYEGGKYKPHFCGKCNLQLRGWNLRAKVTEKGQTVDLLPHAYGVRPLPRIVPIKAPVVVPSPSAIHAAAEAIMADMLGELNVTGYWLKPGGVGKDGAIEVLANPHIVEDRIEFELLPIKTYPGDVVIDPVTPVTQLPKEKLNPDWYKALDLWTNVAARAVDTGVQLLASCPHYGVTDPFHETCHFFQAWSADLTFYEGFTELVAYILNERTRQTLNDSVFTARYTYKFNPGYAELTLTAIDQWLPRLGVAPFADVYIKGNSGPFDDLYTNKSIHSGRLKDDVGRDDLHSRGTNGFKVAKTETGPIYKTTGQLRDDIEAVVASSSIETELRAAIKSFMEFLTSEAGGFTAKKKQLLSGKSGLELSYLQAKYARRQLKQLAFLRGLKEAEHFKAESSKANATFLGGDPDAYISYTRDELKKILDELGEDESDITPLLPKPPYRGGGL